MVTREEKNKEIQNEIEEEKSREKRKKIVKTFFKITIIIIVCFFSLYFYAKYEPTIGLIVKETRITNQKIPDSFNGSKIIQFTDIDYGNNIFQDELDNLVKVINERKPDIVIFTGNLIDNNYNLSTKEKEKIITSLKKINASTSKYAVYGKDDEKDVANKVDSEDENTVSNEVENATNEVSNKTSNETENKVSNEVKNMPAQ